MRHILVAGVSAVVLGLGVFVAPASADVGYDAGDGSLGESSYDDSAYFWDSNWWDFDLTPVGPCDENGCY